ncbi:protein GLUTAMINE DUMPER 2 [Lactuca sativa]|uniref:protein GLUTAMINE DUMPER 2 n=1 Tax=Lactuca sativa TaxID=4236 RepID=UPI000CCA58A2|nr:protein GLUTAMINE DUMPER 2 [Lactuca sativa]
MAAVSSLAPSSPVAPQPSPWHSPVPYLFGGLAAMMGLIAFALLVLACSYWKLSDHLENGDRDIESGDGNTDATTPPENNTNQEASDMQEKYFVIMAGEAKPTFLATPSSSRTTSFGSSSWRSNSTALTEGSSSSVVEMSVEVKHISSVENN